MVVRPATLRGCRVHAATVFGGHPYSVDQRRRIPQCSTRGIHPRQVRTDSASTAREGGLLQYDFLGLFRCFGGTAPCQAVNRDYIIEYPGFVKLNANVSQRISSVISGVVAVSNLTNNKSFELSNLNPVMGRITTIGLQFNY
jgi:hypothetical protein